MQMKMRIYKASVRCELIAASTDKESLLFQVYIFQNSNLFKSPISFISCRWKTVKIDGDQRCLCICWEDVFSGRHRKCLKGEAADPQFLWEPGAQNHLRLPTALPLGRLCPLHALSMFKSFIILEKTEGQTRGLLYKGRKKKKNVTGVSIRGRKGSVEEKWSFMSTFPPAFLKPLISKKK